MIIIRENNANENKPKGDKRQNQNYTEAYKYQQNVRSCICLKNQATTLILISFQSL